MRSTKKGIRVGVDGGRECERSTRNRGGLGTHCALESFTVGMKKSSTWFSRFLFSPSSRWALER